VSELRARELATPTVVNRLSYLRGFLIWARGKGFIKFDDHNNPGSNHASYGAREKRHPSFDWTTGLVGMRFRLEPRDIIALYNDFRAERERVRRLETEVAKDPEKTAPTLWPKNLTDFLTRKLNAHFDVRWYPRLRLSSPCAAGRLRFSACRLDPALRLPPHPRKQ